MRKGMREREREMGVDQDEEQKLQTFMILPKEKTKVWVKQNGNCFQQNSSVTKIEQN